MKKYLLGFSLLAAVACIDANENVSCKDVTALVTQANSKEEPTIVLHDALWLSSSLAECKYRIEDLKRYQPAIAIGLFVGCFNAYKTIKVHYSYPKITAGGIFVVANVIAQLLFYKFVIHPEEKKLRELRSSL